MPYDIDLPTWRDLEETHGADYAAGMIDTFLEEAPAWLAELRAARAAGDLARFRRAAHSLKSNGNTFGAIGLAAQARALELAGFDPPPAIVQVSLAELEATWTRVAADLVYLRDE